MVLYANSKSFLDYLLEFASLSLYVHDSVFFIAGKEEKSKGEREEEEEKEKRRKRTKRRRRSRKKR